MITRKEGRPIGDCDSPSPGSLSGSGSFAGGGLSADFDEWAEWLDREVAAGRDPVPPERSVPAQGVSVSFGDADGIDPALLAAISGTQCLSEDGLGSQFAQHAAADVLPPGPALAALTEAAVKDVTRLSDDQLVGVLQAARRQENREAWKKALVIAEFARRREAEFKRAQARDVPVHCRPGQFPGEELAIELLLGPVQAAHAIDDATDLATRLPQTLAGMAAGLIDEARAGIIALYTRGLTPADAALADGILAALAPTVRLDQLARRAAALGHHPVRGGRLGVARQRRDPRGSRGCLPAPRHPLVRDRDRPRWHRASARLLTRTASVVRAAAARTAARQAPAGRATARATTRARAGGPARRVPPRPERHLPARRQGRVRARGRRAALHPEPQAHPPRPRPHRHLRRAWLRGPGRARRPRPHDRLPRRAHRPVQPGPEVPATPQGQANTRLDSRTARARRHPLDPAKRPHPPDLANRLRHWPRLAEDAAVGVECGLAA